MGNCHSVYIKFRSAQSEFEAMYTFIYTAKVNELSSKTAVLLDTPLVAIPDCGHRHLEYFIQNVDGRFI